MQNVYYKAVTFPSVSYITAVQCPLRTLSVRE